MTKQRAPLSIDMAMARIAGQSGGWAVMADAVGKAERTVRKWGDADAEEEITLKAAIALDILYQENGGIGAPLYEAHGDMVRVAQTERFGDKLELQHATIEFMKENGEAEIALLEAAMPDAGWAEEAKAQREVMQVRAWADKILLRLGRNPHRQKPP